MKVISISILAFLLGLNVYAYSLDCTMTNHLGAAPGSLLSDKVTVTISANLSKIDTWNFEGQGQGETIIEESRTRRIRNTPFDFDLEGSHGYGYAHVTLTSEKHQYTLFWKRDSGIGRVSIYALDDLNRMLANYRLECDLDF